MHLANSILASLENPGLGAIERAALRCKLAKELEEAGSYEAAARALGDLWRGVGVPPRVQGLDQATCAAVLLRAGALAGWLGSVRQVEGAQEKAKDLITRSVELYKGLKDDVRAAEAQTDLGFCYWREGDYDAARIILNEAYAVLRGSDDEARGVNVYRRAIVENASVRPHEALRILKDDEAFIGAVQNHAIKGKYNLALGNALNYLLQGEYNTDQLDRTVLAYTAATYHFEQAGHASHRARVENNLGLLLLGASRHDPAHLPDAKAHLDRARRIFSGLKDAGSVAQVDESRARVLMAEGDYAGAERASRASVNALEKGGENGILAEALTTHGATLVRVGKYDSALKSLERAAEIAGRLGNAEAAARARLVMIAELAGGRLSTEKLRNLYYAADQLLEGSKNLELQNLLKRAARLVISSHEEKSQAVREPVAALVYESEAMAQLVESATRLAPLDCAVLITGETGVGKDLLARYMHRASRRGGHFVQINCAAMPDTLTESQLFGHRKGSFTDAFTDSPGAARLADGGTLFLDEIGELSAANQGKLLRMIENKEIHPVGASQPEQVDVRIVAATNRDLPNMVSEGTFREDLFFRLQTFHIEVPPLRERPDDLTALARYFIREVCKEHKKEITFTDEAVEALKKLELKGNARELRSIVERTVVNSPGGAVIGREEVEVLALRQAGGGDLSSAWEGFNLLTDVHNYERGLIKMALSQSQGKVTEAARLLGISHQLLNKKLAGKHKDLLSERNAVIRRKKSIMTKTRVERGGKRAIKSPRRRAKDGEVARG
jgi:DNA-binding NtrC family response regulator